MIRIGKIVATHGLSGAVVMTHIIGDAKWLKKGEGLFVEMQKGSYIPYFVSQVKKAGEEEFVLELEDVTTMDTARRAVGKHVYINEQVLEGHISHLPLLWIGFKLVDNTKGDLGVIEDIMSTSSQWLAKVTYKDAEVLVPLIEQTIDHLDLKTKTLHVDLPEGLLEVYTGGI